MYVDERLHIHNMTTDHNVYVHNRLFMMFSYTLLLLSRRNVYKALAFMIIKQIDWNVREEVKELIIVNWIMRNNI